MTNLAARTHQKHVVGVLEVPPGWLKKGAPLLHGVGHVGFGGVFVPKSTPLPSTAWENVWNLVAFPSRLRRKIPGSKLFKLRILFFFFFSLKACSDVRGTRI
jgi:hypothetical protein